MTARLATLIDEFPEVLGFCQFLVLGDRNLRTEQEVRECALMQHPVDDHLSVFHLEIKTIVARTEAIEHLAIALDAAEAVIVEGLEILFGNLELIEQFKLLEGVELGKLGGTDLVENDLEHAPVVCVTRPAFQVKDDVDMRFTLQELPETLSLRWFPPLDKTGPLSQFRTRDDAARANSIAIATPSRGGRPLIFISQPPVTSTRRTFPAPSVLFQIFPFFSDENRFHYQIPPLP